jgi:hypothetical protein
MRVPSGQSFWPESVLNAICARFLCCSTTFLVGPARQLRYMFDRTRVIATLIYLACLGGTLWAGFARADLAIVLALLVAQFCALVWYTASYIPYARNAIQSCLCSCFK